MTTITNLAHWIRDHPIIALLIMGVSAYLGKYLMVASSYNNDGLVCLACPLVFILGLPYVFMFLYGVFAIFKHRNILLFPSVLVVCMATFYAPRLLPLPNGHAAQHFFDNRRQYETIVELARNDKLPQKSGPYWYAETVKSKPLVVTFRPFKSSDVIVFAEKEAYLQRTVYCDLDGNVYDQIDTHWWVCHLDWL